MDRLSEYVLKQSFCRKKGCDIQIDCETCQEIMLQEHDKKIREDVIREYKSKLKTDVCARAQNYSKTIFNERNREQEIFNFATKTFLDALDYFAKQLKEQK